MALPVIDVPTFDVEIPALFYVSGNKQDITLLDVDIAGASVFQIATSSVGINQSANSAALLSLTGLDFITAISGAATSISNVGPGLGPIIGPNGDFSVLPDISKWILTVGMILGRLELFAILVLFLPSFWRN